VERRGAPDNPLIALTGSHLVLKAPGVESRFQKPCLIREYIWGRVNGKAIGQRRR